MYTNDVDFYVGEITHVAGNATNPFIPADAEERVSALLFAEETAAQMGGRGAVAASICTRLDIRTTVPYLYSSLAFSVVFSP